MMENTATATATPCFHNHHQPQEPDAMVKDDSEEHLEEDEQLDWHGAPVLDENSTTRDLRLKCRNGEFTTPTNSQCKGYLQCNLVILPQEYALDFMIFCQRNRKACPLIEVLDVGSPYPTAVAREADLRTDLPKYSIYRHGELEQEVLDIKQYWRDDLVSFLIGCSFSFDGALEEAGITLPKKVPMFKTSIKCRSAGIFKGNVVVSMRPIDSTLVAKELEITSKFPHAHGGPICIGMPESIGIVNIDKPDWGEAVSLEENQVPVFHACGVTPQNVLLESKIPFCITHSAGHMFVTDLPADKVPF